MDTENDDEPSSSQSSRSGSPITVSNYSNFVIIPPRRLSSSKSPSKSPTTVRIPSEHRSVHNYTPANRCGSRARAQSFAIYEDETATATPVEPLPHIAMGSTGNIQCETPTEELRAVYEAGLTGELAHDSQVEDGIDQQHTPITPDLTTSANNVSFEEKIEDEQIKSDLETDMLEFEKTTLERHVSDVGVAAKNQDNSLSTTTFTPQSFLGRIFTEWEERMGFTPSQPSPVSPGTKDRARQTLTDTPSGRLLQYQDPLRSPMVSPPTGPSFFNPSSDKPLKFDPLPSNYHGRAERLRRSCSRDNPGQPMPLPGQPEPSCHTNSKKRKRVAPTLITSVIDAARDRHIATHADTVIENHPDNNEARKRPRLSGMVPGMPGAYFYEFEARKKTEEAVMSDGEI